MSRTYVLDDNSPVLHGVISGATQGDNTLAALVANKNIRVLSLMLVAADATTVRFESNAGGTALTGIMTMIASTPFVLPHNPCGWFETVAGQLLNMELGSAVQVSGSFTYQLIE